MSITYLTTNLSSCNVTCQVGCTVATKIDRK